MHVGMDVGCTQEYKCHKYWLCQMKECIEGTFLITFPLLEVAVGRCVYPVLL